jgi:uncharacterized protein (TIGR00369 family)
MTVSPEQLEKILADTAFARPFGFRVRSIGDGECSLEAPFQAAFERPGGIVSGQVYVTAADVAFWFAIKTRLGLEDASVSSEINTAFLSAARQEDVICNALVLKLGRRLIFGTAQCVSAGGRLLTHHTLTYARSSQPSGD